MRFRNRRTAFYAAAWIGAAWVGLTVVPGGSGAAWAAEPVALAGTNLLGEACRTAPRSDIVADPSAPAPESLFCGSSSRSAGAVGAVPLPPSLPQGAAERHALLEKAAASGSTGRSIRTRMTCPAGEWVQTTAKHEILIKPCSLNDGAWPRLEVVMPLGRYLFVAEGLPSALTALADLAARQAGQSGEAGGGFGDAEAARALLSQAFHSEAWRVSGNDDDRFRSLVEAARLDDSRKDFRAAEDSYRQALAIQEKALGAAAPGVGATLMSLALEVSNQGRYDEAAGLFRRADPIVQRSPIPADQARYFSYMAYDAANAGRFADGVRYAGEAAESWRRLAESNGPDLEDLGGGAAGRSVMRGELGHALNFVAKMAVRTGQITEAEAAAKEALQIIAEEKGLPPWWKPEVLATVGEVYARLGRLNEADQSFRGALIYQQRLFGETAPTAFTLLSLAGVYSAEGNDNEAVRAFGLALKILSRDEHARAGLIFDQLAPLFASATNLATAKPDQREAMEGLMFQALQMAESGVADQTIARASARLAAETPAMRDLVHGLETAEHGRDEARITLAAETALPDEQRGSRKEAAILADLNRWTEEANLLSKRIWAEFPAYYALSRAAPLDLAGLRKRLGIGEALVLFRFGREKSLAVAITADRFTARSLDLGEADLAASVRELRRAVTVNATGHVAAFDLAGAYELYRGLIGPIEPVLAGVRQLIMVPDGPLSSLPPGLLVMKKPDGSGDYRHAAFLARRWATSTVPSVRAFVALRDRPKATGERLPFLGLGAPLFEGGRKGLEAMEGQCRGDGPMPAEALKALAPLPDTAEEVRSVARALGGGADSVLLGANATEAALRARDLSKIRVLYFATHGFLPGELSCRAEPGLALSPPPKPAASRAEDGLLEGSEIAGLRLDADLVVLSACNTAQSAEKYGGESLTGLAGAFFYAGARNLVASHWQVPSGSTAELMTGLFQRYEKLGAAEALRQAQLALIDKDATAHPFNWAAFTVIGAEARQ